MASETLAVTGKSSPISEKNLMIGVVATLVLVISILQKRAIVQRRREERMAFAAR
jgi:hypothetical protein